MENIDVLYFYLKGKQLQNLNDRLGKYVVKPVCYKIIPVINEIISNEWSRRFFS